MTTPEQHYFFGIFVKIVGKNHVVILLDEQNFTDINVHNLFLFKLIELRDYFRPSVVEQFRSAGELLK